MANFRLPSEIPEEQWPAASVFVEEAMALVRAAQEQGILLRIMGGLAIHLHSLEHEALWRGLKRLGAKVFTDIDFVAYGRDRAKLLKFFAARGYSINQKMLYFYGMGRQIYYGDKVPMVEIFFDALQMNHRIAYKGRLEADSPTLPAAELLLQKLQMVGMNEKDIKDSIVLLRAHELGDGDGERINRAMLGKRLFRDWGFHHTAVKNLGRIRMALPGYPELGRQDEAVVLSRVEELEKYLAEGAKSIGWKLRSLAGTRLKWYNPVDDWDVIDTQAGSAS
jgi:hypothetical protein